MNGEADLLSFVFSFLTKPKLKTSWVGLSASVGVATSRGCESDWQNKKPLSASQISFIHWLWHCRMQTRSCKANWLSKMIDVILDDDKRYLVAFFSTGDKKDWPYWLIRCLPSASHNIINTIHIMHIIAHLKGKTVFISRHMHRSH